MKLKYKLALISILFLVTFQNCSDDYDDVLNYRSAKDFVWSGLNQYYLYQESVPDLFDTRFPSLALYDEFLNTYSSPEALFFDLKREDNVDRFSVIFNDYEVLENLLSGSNKNNGVDYELRRKTPGSEELFGIVRYILPNSNASNKPVSRGFIFYAVNNTPLTTSNYNSLLANETYTLNFADYNNGNITSNGQSVTLTKTEYSENPVFIKNTHILNGKKVGYLLYNGFYSNYKNELNEAFAYFQAENITHLVLDLRYNSGGSVQVATELASMITGQFNNAIFAKQQWNSKIISAYQNNLETFNNRFTSTLSNGNVIHSLNLSQVYIITTKATASASELIINGLNPYINVVKLGSTTTGKNVGSITLYDSPTFQKTNVNPNHKYAMQPIVLKIINKNNFGEYSNGFSPDVSINEDLANFGTLGENSETLLAAALNYINTNGRLSSKNTPIETSKYYSDSKSRSKVERGLYLENNPIEITK